MSELPQASGDVESLAPESLAARLRDGEAVSVLDVRSRAEADAWPLSGETVTTYHVPYYRFVEAKVNDGVSALADDVRSHLDEPLVVICGRGEASAFVAELLSEAGVDAANLERGMRGWAGVVHRVDIDTSAVDRVVQYQRPSSGCLSYLVVSDGDALLVDPLRALTDRYLADIEDAGLELVACVDTHVHADHVSGCRALRDETGATVVLPEGARARGLAFDARLLAPGETVTVGRAALRAVALPGHTTEQLGLELDGLLFSGDTVFLGSVARPDLEVGSDEVPDAARRLYETLSGIDDDWRIAPTHFSTERPDETGAYVARMATLRARIPLLSASREAFVEQVTDEMPPRPANDEQIIAVNLGRESLDDEAAFEAELGPNNCAAAPSAPTSSE